jgi:hypothetical protein
LNVAARQFDGPLQITTGGWFSDSDIGLEVKIVVGWNGDGIGPAKLNCVGCA